MTTRTSQSVKLTRQGVRDLNAIGPKPKRGHVGTPKERDQARCAHFWRVTDDGPLYEFCDHCGVERP